MAKKDAIDSEVLTAAKQILGFDRDGFYELVNEYLEAIVKYKKKPLFVDPDEYNKVKGIVLNLNKSLNIETEEDNNDPDADLNDYIKAINDSF